MSDRLSLRPTDRPRHWELLEDFTCMGYTVPKGFVTDLASVPIGLRWLFPHGGKKAKAAVLHDYLYATHVTDKVSADKLFLKVMRFEGVGKVKSWFMYTAVKLFGHFAYRKGGVHDV